MIIRKKLVSIATMGAMLAALVQAVPANAEGITSVDVGEYVKLGTYNNAEILWRCIKNDENGAMMISDRIITIKAYDRWFKKFGSATWDSRRYSNGSNYWEDSDIRIWLNSSAAAGEVDWTGGDLGITYNTGNTGPAYSGEAGFMSNFARSELAVVNPVTHKTYCLKVDADNGGSDGGSSMYAAAERDAADWTNTNSDAWYKNTTDRFFLLDSDEAQLLRTLEHDVPSSTVRTYTRALPTKEAAAVANAENNNTNLNENYVHTWVLRSPGISSYSNYTLSYIDTYGQLLNTSSIAPNNSNGIRPAFYLKLKDGYELEGTGTEAAPYTLKAPATVAENENGETYATISDAVNASTGDSVIKLLDDVDENVTVATDATLDLNNNSLDISKVASNGGKLTIAGSGTITGEPKPGVELELKGGTTTFDPQIYLGSGYAEKVGSGTYEVVPLTSLNAMERGTVKSAIDNGEYEQMTVDTKTPAVTAGKLSFTVSSKGNKNIANAIVTLETTVSGTGDVRYGLIVTGIPDTESVTITLN